MTEKAYDNFITRNALIAIKELEGNPLKPAGFVLVPLEREIYDAGLNPDDFYFNPHAPELPYCYYRGMAMLDFPSLHHKAREIKALIVRLEQDLTESVAKRDFDRFLALIDDRLAPDLFMEVFNFIPDQDKFRLFERIWRFNETSHTVFTKEFIKKVDKYKGVNASQPAADERGYVEVYRSLDYEGLPPQNASSWTMDVNIAIIHALPLTPAPIIYHGFVHLNDIIAYDSHKAKREITVRPFKVDQLKAMDLINLREFEGELQSSGILKRYSEYTRQIDIKWFHNPSGIHALSHTRRVLLLSLLIGYLEDYSKNDRDLLGWAAVYHDIGRTNDGYDPDHGMSSYDKLIKQNLLELDDDQEQEILRFLIQNHAIPDQSAYKKLSHYKLTDVDRTLKLYDAFKDADGLDRVRINDLNPEYLRTPSAHRLLLAAHQLYRQQVVY
jgi:HD domain.